MTLVYVVKNRLYSDNFEAFALYKRRNQVFYEPITVVCCWSRLGHKHNIFFFAELLKLYFAHLFSGLTSLI